MVNIGIHIHRIEKISIQKIHQLPETKSYTSKIKIEMKDKVIFEIDLFSDNKKSLKILNKNLK